MELPRTMELPKNIVQIGKPDPTHKIFVEDYVISYMKQWNKHGKKDTGIVLYGKKMTEGDCRYYFVYGASYLPGVEARMQYLTDDEKEEAKKNPIKKAFNSIFRIFYSRFFIVTSLTYSISCPRERNHSRNPGQSTSKIF